MATAPIHAAKACTKCGEEKPATTDFFDTHSGCRFGVHSICQDCQHGKVGYSAERIALRELRSEAAKIGLKVCATCEQPKSDTFEYFFNDHRRGGLLPRCRDCMKVLRRVAYARDVVKPREAKRERLPAGCKRCRDCKEIKQTSAFHPSEGRGGVRPECRLCMAAAQSKAYYVKTVGRKRQRLTPFKEGECKTCGRCKADKPADQIHFYPSKKGIHGLSTWCRACKSDYHRTYLKHQPHVQASRRASKANRNARMRGKTGFVSGTHILMLRSEQDGRCCYCFNDLTVEHVDHFIPVACGGEHIISNLVLACAPCNLTKSAKMPWEWRPDLFKPPL